MIQKAHISAVRLSSDIFILGILVLWHVFCQESGYCMEGDKEEPPLLDLPAIALNAEGAGQAQLSARREE